MELWWNCAAEEQAFSRVYRMGQQKEVHVVRLECAGTREDEILEMQDFKEAELSDCLMSGKVTKSNHSFHSLFALIGMPRIENGKFIGLEKPEKDCPPNLVDEKTEDEDEGEEEEGPEDVEYHDQDYMETGKENLEEGIKVDASDDPMEDVRYSENGASADGGRKSDQPGGSASIIFED